MSRASGPDRLDILIAHDAPAGLDLSASRLPAEDQVRTDEARSLIATAVEATLPRIVFHGHWHHAHDTELAWIDRSRDRAGRRAHVAVDAGDRARLRRRHRRRLAGPRSGHARHPLADDRTNRLDLGMEVES